MDLSKLPEEILILIAQFICARSNWDQIGGGAYNLHPDDRKTLFKMSRTCKTLHRITLPFIFRHVVVRYDVHSPSVKGFRALGNSKAAAHVRRLDIELAHRQPTTTLVHIKDMAGILTCHLSRIPNLYGLRFNFDAPPRPSPFLAEARAQLTTALVTALRYVDLSNLRELDIYLPITYSFAQFFSNESTTSRLPIESVCRRLRHLGVGVRNWTCRTSPRHWVRDVLPEDARYPNEQYVKNLFKLVEAAEDAESLSICCTNPLDFTGVSFPQRLESLHLSGVVLSSDDLASIFQKPTSMRAVQLFVVCLRAGTWKELLQPLSQRCPTTLVEFIAESCGYSSTGPSAHLYDALLPEPDNPSCIESRDYSDVLSLHLLQKKVIANQEIAKLPYCYEYDRAKRMDLNDLLERLEIN